MENKKTGIEAIETFVAEIPACTLEQALAKFHGRRTPKTLAAARRIVAAGKRVKIPRHLLRQLWRITGGWKGLSEGNADCGNIRPLDNPLEVTEFLETWGNNSIKTGDLNVVVEMQESSAPKMGVLLYRGVVVAKVASESGWSHLDYTWNDPAKVRGALSAKIT